MTLVAWGNLTLSLDGRYSAQELMIRVLDQIYALSPLPPKATPTATTAE